MSTYGDPQQSATTGYMTARGIRPPALPWWKHLEALRLEKGWTRSQLAQRAGVARSTVDGWKTNPRPPLVTTITEVADRLEIDRRDALRLAGLTAPATSPPTEGVGDETATDRLERLWREYRDDPGERGTVLRELLETWGDRETG